MNITSSEFNSARYFDGETIPIKYAKLDRNAKTPVFNPSQNGGIDLYPSNNFTWNFLTGLPAIISTGLAFQLPEGVHAMVVGRSGNAFKRNIIPFYGLIDSSYRGEIKVLLNKFNTAETESEFTIPDTTAIAQLVFLPYKPINLLNSYLLEVLPEELETSERADKGFGSSGHL